MNNQPRDVVFALGDDDEVRVMRARDSRRNGRHKDLLEQCTAPGRVVGGGFIDEDGNVKQISGQINYPLYGERDLEGGDHFMKDKVEEALANGKVKVKYSRRPPAP